MEDKPPASCNLDDLVASIQEVLRRDVIDVWFPRCVDRLRGGYDCDFDRRWRYRGPQHRLLEFQARQMRTAARLALAFPEEERFSEFARHGLRHLRDVMWDHQYGGWYALMGSDGTPLAGGTKHAHGTAYAAQACAVVFKATGDPEARGLAEEAFEWFDSRAHDDEHGGYHSWLTREGRVIRSAEEVPAGAGTADPVAEAIGFRDVNVHGDWLEGLSEIVSILNARGPAGRLQEIAGIFLNHITTPYGDLYFGFREDWSPLPQPERFGYAFQAVERLISAASLVPEGDRLRARAVAIGQHALRHAARSDGGYVFLSAIHAPEHLEGARLVGRRRVWWVQLAALNVLAIFASSRNDSGTRYHEALRSHWQFIQERLVDPVYGGFYPVVPQDLGLHGALRGRFGKSREQSKGNIWKDASHEADTLLATLQVLGTERRTPHDAAQGELSVVQPH
ncbi:MAG TPA: AGE family epimerase/isomerase [Gemmatimonadota bacterium]|nr:AGE family epimerase/isomerase [Gemmatimonadota bacterium]